MTKALNRILESGTDLDEDSEMIIFESLLTTFSGIVIFEIGAAVLKIGSSLKQNYHNPV